MSDPKLLAARAEILAVLKRYDIAGHIVLHNAPGNLEIFSKFDPSYSRLIGLPPVVRLRSKAADYGGDKDAQRRDLEATANMVSGIATTMAENAMNLLNLAAWIDNATGAKHTPLHPGPDSTEH
jgi:hypothetical protein